MVLATRVSVRPILASAWSYQNKKKKRGGGRERVKLDSISDKNKIILPGHRPNNLGARMAGQKKRKNIKPEMAVYETVGLLLNFERTCWRMCPNSSPSGFGHELAELKMVLIVDTTTPSRFLKFFSMLSFLSTRVGSTSHAFRLVIISLTSGLKTVLRYSQAHDFMNTSKPLVAIELPRKMVFGSTSRGKIVLMRATKKQETHKWSQSRL